MLGVHQIRGVEIVDEAAPGHLLPLVLDGEVADPARHPGVDGFEALLVISHIAHRLDLLVDGQFFHLGQPHPQVLLDLGADGNGARRAALFLFIDGDEVHPHVVLGGGIALVAGIHGIDPVEGGLLLGRGASGGLFGDPVAATGAKGEQQGRYQQFLAHRTPPLSGWVARFLAAIRPVTGASDIISLLLCRPPDGRWTRHHPRDWQQTGRSCISAHGSL